MERRTRSLAHKVALAALLAPTTLSIVVVGLGSLKVLVDVYNLSITAGLVLTLTGVPLVILFAGMYVGYAAQAAIWEYDADNRWEYWVKTTLLSLAALIATWIAYVIGAWLFAAVGTWLAN